MASNAYNYGLVEDLKRQIMYSPKSVKKKVVRRIEKLTDEITNDQNYTYDYVCFRITGYRPPAVHEKLFSGKELRQDGLRFLDEISASLKERAKDCREPVYTVNGLARMFDVSPKTISRWRKLGLKSRKMIFDGHGLRTAFLESYIDSFLKHFGPQIKRLAALRELTAEDRRVIIDRARQLMLKEHNGFSRTVELLSSELGHPADRIREILKERMGLVTGDNKNPSREGLTCFAVASSFAEGASIGELARQYNQTRSAIWRTVYRALASEILGESIEYIENPVYHLPQASAIILGNPLSEKLLNLITETNKATRNQHYTYSIQVSTFLLSREQEADLFRRYNYLKFRMRAVQEEIRDSRTKVGLVRRYERYRKEALEIREIILRTNMRLVLSIARKHVGRQCDLPSLISDGSLSLIKAIEKFDFSRGNKFSTYATWAIMKNYAKSIPEENYKIGTLVTGRNELLEQAPSQDEPPGKKERDSAIRKMVGRMMGALGEREAEIIRRRYGIGRIKEPATLEELGQDLGLTKERVRQIEAKALDKLKHISGSDNARSLLE